MRKRILCSVALLSLTAVAASAQELKVWDWKSGDPSTATYFDKVKSTFEAAHPGVTVSFASQPHDQYYTILGTAIAAKQGPDVVLLHGGSQAQERTGALVRLDDKVADIAKDIVGWDAFTGADGGVYAVPLSIQGFVVYYNKALYKASGLDPDKPPRTWAELTAACKALGAKTVCFSLGNKEGFGADFFLSALAANGWSKSEQEAWAKGKLKWSDPPVKAIVQAWLDTYKAGWYAEGANSTLKFMDEYESFMRGENANTIGLISDVAHWKQFGEMLGDDKIGVFRMPAPMPASDNANGELRMPFAGGIGYAVTNFSAHRDLAIELAKTFASPAAMQVFFNDAGAIAANTKVDTSSLASPSAKTILSWLSCCGTAIAHNNMSTAEVEEWHRQSQVLLGGGTTVDAVVARLDQVRAATRK